MILREFHFIWIIESWLQYASWFHLCEQTLTEERISEITPAFLLKLKEVLLNTDSLREIKLEEILVYVISLYLKLVDTLVRVYVSCQKYFPDKRIHM